MNVGNIFFCGTVPFLSGQLLAHGSKAPQTRQLVSVDGYTLRPYSHGLLSAVVAPQSAILTLLCCSFSLVAVEELEFRDLNLRENVALLAVLKVTPSPCRLMRSTQ